MALKGWIDGDESAKEMLSRVLRERPFLLLPPLHRVPLRVGNVVELVGPSPSAKTQILLQAAIGCVLPMEWNGLHYGGLGKLVIFIDLDCRFDILRLSQMLKNRIMEANGNNPNITYDGELFALSMRRFLYSRCYDSLQFLATLKTLHYRLQKEKEARGINAHLLMIDGFGLEYCISYLVIILRVVHFFFFFFFFSIGAFHWIDRASTSLHLDGDNRKGLSLQNVSETVVQEIKKLLLVHPMLVIATKATILGDRHAATEVKWGHKRPCSPETSGSRNLTNNMRHLYREYMPCVWQSFVTHRMLVRAADDRICVNKHHSQSIYLSEWLLPPLGVVDNFVVKDVRRWHVSHNCRCLVYFVKCACTERDQSF